MQTNRLLFLNNFQTFLNLNCFDYLINEYIVKTMTVSLPEMS